MSVKQRRRIGAVAVLKRRLIRERGDRCEVGVEGCLGCAAHVHHLRLRSQGGSDAPGNVLLVCATYHARIHARVAWAVAHGYVIQTKEGAL